MAYFWDAKDAQWLLLCAYWQMKKPAVLVGYIREIGKGSVGLEAQQFLLSQVINNEISVRYPSPPAYTIRVLKAVIEAAEEDSQRHDFGKSTTWTQKGHLETATAEGRRALNETDNHGAKGAEGGDRNGEPGGAARAAALEATAAASSAVTRGEDLGHRETAGALGGHVDEEDAVLGELCTLLCDLMANPEKGVIVTSSSTLREESAPDLPGWCHQTFAYSTSTTDQVSASSSFPSPSLQISEAAKNDSRSADQQRETVMDSHYSRHFDDIYADVGRREDESSLRAVEVKASAIQGLISLRMSLNMLEGNTGCHVWPASFHLADVLLSNPSLVAGRVCVELGSGSGLLGVCLAQLPAVPKEVILTDGDEDTLLNLCHNLLINDVNTTGLSDGREEMDKASPTTLRVEGREEERAPKVTIRHLDWETASEDGLQALRPDVVLGADVAYDPTVIPHLVRVIAALLRKPSGTETSFQSVEPCKMKSTASLHPPLALIANVVRSRDTWQLFIEEAARAGLDAQLISPSMLPLTGCFAQHGVTMDESVSLLALRPRRYVPPS
eukprot:TRINITY_DN21058_c0_g1_i1.p1 TRINITY_DN21058_c0_g1~~TRINITY_DN21058_c0_g1_i1.p1  ORF type:complete len:557 (+),score=85.07 TRINITY_DN21058_c0_g1_i1:36-1706(+)